MLDTLCRNKKIIRIREEEMCSLEEAEEQLKMNLQKAFTSYCEGIHNEGKKF
jgi:hypothetical protein